MVKITYTKPRVYTPDETLENFPLSRDTIQHRWVLICSYNCIVCTLFGDVCPLWVGEGVGALTNPLFHTGGDGGTTRTVERREPTQPRGGGMRKDSLCADDRVYTVYVHVHVHVCAVFSPGPFSIAAPMPSIALFLWCGHKLRPNHAHPLGLHFILGRTLVCDYKG